MKTPRFTAAVFTTCLTGSMVNAQVVSHLAPGPNEPGPRSAQYEQVQQRLARGWNTWDVHSVATQVLLPQGLAIHVGLKHNSTLNGDEYLGDALIGRLTPGAAVVTPGPHAWDGSYTRADFEWKGHRWRIETAHDGEELVMEIAPLKKVELGLPPTLILSLNFLWGQPGIVDRTPDHFLAHTGARSEE